MEGLRLPIILLLTVAIVTGLRNVVQYEMQEVYGIKHEAVGSWWRQRMNAQGKPARLTKYSWNDCGGAESLIHVNSFILSPDPVVEPGRLNLTASINVKTAMVSPVQGNITILYRPGATGPWVKVPCIAMIGSCVYEDVCELMSLITTCPPQLVDIGFTCSCPIEQKIYNIQQLSFDISTAILPAGEYMLTGNLTYNGQEELCLHLNITIES